MQGRGRASCPLRVTAEKARLRKASAHSVVGQSWNLLHLPARTGHRDRLARPPAHGPPAPRSGEGAGV